MSNRALLNVLALGAVLSLSACAELNQVLEGRIFAPAPSPTGQGQALPTAEGQTADALDSATTAEREAATRPAAAGRRLGQTVASLGTPSEPGFWLKTPLVSDRTAGRIRDPRSGTTVAVTLIPIDGPATAGSRLSLSAMRALGVSLTDLVNLEVTG